MDRFWSKVKKTEGCWNWTASLTNAGYGTFRLNSQKVTTAHRASWTLLKGVIPDGMDLDHLCLNKKCVNPDHLEVVTHRENCRRIYKDQTHCWRGHEFNEENTYICRRGLRVCRACNRIRDKERYHSKRRSP